MRIHVTDRQTFKTCRRKWKYESAEHLVPKAGSQYDSPLWYGSAIHKCLAEYYQTGQAPVQTWLALTQGLPIPKPTQALAEWQLSEYEAFAAETDNWEVLKVETEMATRIPGTRVHLVGTLDLLVKQAGKLWIVDHKTLSQLPTESSLELDDQMTAYMWLCHQHGYPVAGAIYNVLRKKLPTVPKLLANGALSRDKSIDTTTDVYYREIVKNGLNPDDYSDILEHLAQKENTFFWRTRVRRNVVELKEFERYLSAEGRDMTTCKMVPYPNPSWECGWCDFRLLCKCENEGGDVEHLKNAFFRVERRRI